MSRLLTLNLSVDSGLLNIQAKQLFGLLEHLPKRRARRFSRKAYRLFLGADISQIRIKRGGAAAAAGDIALQIRVAGLDGLIAAAMRAGGSI
jgi:hypothetical protein